MPPIYAIGDIHGYAQQLDRALSLIEADGGPDAQIVFLGDYTDRGPDSRGVLDRLIAGRDAGRNWTFLKGNHDRMFEWYAAETPRHDPHLFFGLSWLHYKLGGDTTLASYGVEVSEKRRHGEIHAEAREAIPQTHLDFLRDLPLHHQADGKLFVHAGIRPGVPLAKQDENDLLWIRDGWLTNQRDHGALVVHGHTALDHPEHHRNRVNLDGGAGYGRTLVPAVFEGSSVWTLDEQGRKVLAPA